jgi:hypothetical protein
MDVVVLDGLNELPSELCLDPGTARVAVVTGQYDHIGRLLDDLGVTYDSYSGTREAYLDLLLDPTALAAYDIVFLNCGIDFDWLGDQDTIADNLRDFVANGGSVYASDWGYGFIEAAWPDAIDEQGDDALWDPATYDGSRLTPFTGAAGDVSAEVVDATMQAVLGSDHASINFDLDGWVVLADIGSGTSVLFQGDVQTWDLLFTHTSAAGVVPLAVSFQPGGTVIFTSFHNADLMTTDMEAALDEIILTL